MGGAAGEELLWGCVCVCSWRCGLYIMVTNSGTLNCADLHLKSPRADLGIPCREAMGALRDHRRERRGVHHGMTSDTGAQRA